MRELEHLVVADLPDLPRRRAHVWVGRVDAVHIRVDFTHIGADGSGDSDGGGVGAATAEGRDVPLFIDPLEAGEDCDFPGGKRLLNA